MKTNPNDPITPCVRIDNNEPLYHDGLTKREHMAIEFTKAFISIEYSSGDECVRQGIVTADKLIAALNKEEQ